MMIIIIIRYDALMKYVTSEDYIRVIKLCII